MTKVLVVDDQFSDRELTKDILEDLGFSVDTVSCGKDAIEKLKNQKYDIVLTDLMMPEIDGLQLVKLIKENNFDTQVILMTAYATIDTAVEAIKLGAYDYLVKPLNKQKISIVIKNCLEADKLSKEVKMLQQKILNLEKMAVISKFSSSIAHQLRNPLFVIQSTATILAEKFHQNKEILENLELIIRNTQHADNVIHNLLRITDFNNIKLDKTPLNETITETIKMMEPVFIKENIKIIQELTKDILVLADRSCLEQCFMNIIMNSIEAIDTSKKEPTVKIKTYLVNSTIPHRRSEDIKTNKFACVEIEDNGKGIPEKFISKVFEPFFTLKDKGIGLGLFFVYQVIVSCFSGDIKIESVENKGTKITILLPSIE